jgi:hypothetical protein
MLSILEDFPGLLRRVGQPARADKAESLARPLGRQFEGEVR